MQEVNNDGCDQGLHAESAAAVKAELDQILASQAFQGSHRPGAFLRYVVEQTLEGNGDHIKEYCIATEVFGRKESFDPRLDPVVRVEATKLRSRLATYYESEGRRDPIRIELPKRGYVPTFRESSVAVANAEALLAAASDPSEAAPQAANAAPRGRKKGWWIAIGVAAACVAAVGAAYAWNRSAPPPDTKSIAVLPFTNVGGDKEDEYFSDGLTDELIASLGRVPGLRVVARGSVFQFKNKTYDIREVGRRLNVRTVLEGSVRKVGTRLRITVHLDDSTNGYRIWSDIYDRDSKDVLAIQREIAQGLVNSLGIEFAGNALASGSGATKHAAATINPDAYQAYLKGLFFWNKNTSSSIRTAIDYFNQALAKDPNYPPIYTGLGRCYTALAVFTATPSMEVVPKIREVASKALALDPTFGEAHLQLGEVAFVEYKWEEAERELKQALELSPGDAVVHRWYSYYLGRMGRGEEELAQTRAAQELDPVSPYLAEGVAKSYVDLRRYDEAIDQYKKALTLDPNYVMLLRGLGVTYVIHGDYDKGIALLERVAPLDKEDISIDGELGYAYAITGRRAAAENILATLLAAAQNGKARPLHVAEVYIGLGDKDHAFEWLLKAADEHEIALGPRSDAMLDSLRSDLRFRELLRRMKLL
jgi:TolB-like protein/Flp pilus assembly protein TadD